MEGWRLGATLFLISGGEYIIFVTYDDSLQVSKSYPRLIVIVGKREKRKTWKITRRAQRNIK